VRGEHRQAHRGHDAGHREQQRDGGHGHGAEDEQQRQQGEGQGQRLGQRQVVRALAVHPLADGGGPDLLHAQRGVLLADRRRLREQRVDVLLARQLFALHGHSDPEGLVVLGAQRRSHALDLRQAAHPLTYLARGLPGLGAVERAGTRGDQYLFDGFAAQPTLGGDGLGAAGLADAVVLGGGGVAAHGDAGAQAHQHEQQPAGDRSPGVQGAPAGGLYGEISHTSIVAARPLPPTRAAG
jgi:hypothetical protein